jgi:signal transduction histidine kinase/CheY-like chemotaxis protein
LNLASGRKARKEAAFEHAFDYCSYGMDLLSESCWETNYELSLDLHTEAAQAAYLSGRIEDMESIASLVLDKAKTLLDRTKAHEVMIQGYFATARFTEAVEEGVKVLGDFGVHFPKKHQNIYLLWEFIKTKLALIGKAPESLVDLPEVKNDSELAIRRVTGSIWLPIYCGKPELIPYVALKMVRWSAKNGNSDESPYSYAAYALIVNAIQGDIESSYRFGQIARMTIEKVDTRQAAPRTLFVVNYMIRHWKEHPKLMIEPFKEIYRMGLDVGDYEFASLSGYASVLFPFFSGGELNSLQKEMGRMNDAMLVMKQNSLLQHGLLVRQVMLNLEGPPDGVTEINGEVYSEDGSIPKYQETNEIIGLFHVYFYKMILCYMFEKYPDAEIFALETEKYLECVVGIIHGPIFNFYDSLIRLATINSASTFKRRRFWSRIKSNQKQMKRWMEHSQTNFSHKYYLVEAERHRFLGNHLKATHFYDLATRLAQKNDFLNEEALANELAAKYYLAREMKTCARAYLEQARYCYFRWGANAKVEQIERRYGDLIGQAPSASTHDTKENRQKKSLTDTTSTGIRENLDLEAIIKASQAISTEISITSLMGQLLKITIESSGAQRGFLILETGRELNIEATAEITNEGLINIEIGRKPEFQGISKSVVDYVARTRLKVALDDASQKGLFINDPYILKHKPISILCVPIIYQGKLIGVIYLENNITIGAFTEDRLIVMDLLLTQAAISLEIAHLFDNLEQQVELRTEQLSEAKEKADTANKAKSVFLASMSHELRTPLNSILGFSQVLKRDNSLSMENKQAIEVIEHSGEHLLNLINDVLDLAKIEARKMELSESVFYLPSIVSSVFDIFHIPAKKKGLSLSLMTINRPQDESQRDASDIENVLPPIWLRGDERRLRQILINIVGNALKFTDKGGVTVEVGRVRQLEPPKIEPMTDEDCSNTKIRFRISDTGIGIEKEKIEKLFEPFYQGATPSTQDQGTGLGLAICQNFLHLMGSKLNVESIPGEGTIFWFDIDFLESSAHSVGASHKIHDIISFSGKKLRILIVDDNSENRQLFVRILRDIGFDTIESSGGKEALNIALEVNPDIVIIDLFMPDMSGFELIQLIRKNDQIKCVGIIATSASVNDEERLNSLASGANSFLPKPFNPRELLDEIKNISDIEFVYNPADADIEKNIVLTQDVTINADLIEKMSRLASMGDVTTLRSQIMDLEKSDERLKPLTEKLDQLATKFQMRQLQKVLKQIKPHQ